MPDGNVHFKGHDQNINSLNKNLKKIINNKTNVMKRIIQLSLTFIAVITISCHKTVEPQPQPADGTLLLHLHTNVDTNEVDAYGNEFKMTGGRRISVDMAQLYLSHFKLVKMDGTTYDVPNAVVLQVQESESYFVANVPSGNYKSIQFSVGLDPATNLKVPSSSPTDVLNRPEMWFGASAQPSGYVFVNFQGSIDTTTVPNPAGVLQPFSYKVGTNANLKQVTLPDQNYSVSPGQTQVIHVTTDYDKLFTNVLLNDQSNLMITSPAANGTPLGTTISNNISSMFDYEIM
jgi:hypothetical protein